MPAQPVGRWYRVGEILALFQQMGCEVRELPGHIEDDAGQAFSVRYVLNHENDRFVTITDLDDDDRVPATEVEGWMRRLGVEIPLPPSA